MFTRFRSRLLTILVVINLFVLFLGGSAYYFLGEVGHRLENFTQGIYARVEISNRLRAAADARALAVRNIALLSDSAARTQQIEEFKRRQAETQKELQALQTAVSAAGVPEAVRAKVTAITDVESRYRPVAEAIVQQLQNGERDAAIAQIERVCTPTLQQLTAAINDYAALTQQRTRAYVDDTESTTRTEKATMMAAAVVAVAAAGTLGALLRRSIHRTLGAEPEELKEDLVRVAQGDLSVVATTSHVADDSLSAALQRMRAQIGSIVQRVRATSDNIASASTDIANGNANLSGRTDDQAQALQQTASTMDELGVVLRHASEGAGQADQLAQSAAELATAGGQAVGRVVSTMQGIHDSSREIGDIIGVIDSIAFQTNILALNAAVEAARAGEQGRGFAVVASEVRSLAQRSAEAAKEIKRLVSRNVEQVEQGASLVQDAGQRMDEVVASIRRVSALVAEINAATVAQSQGVQRVSDAVGRMDAVTQQNATLVEESATAADRLKAQAQELVSAVSAFRIGHAPQPV